VVAENVAEVAAGATLTDAGTVRLELVLERATLAPLAGAPELKETVQVLEELDPRRVGVHAREETSAGTTRLTFAVAELLL
jgi:hypothetical protein